MFRNKCLEFTVCEFGSLGPGFRAFSDRVKSCGKGGMLRALHALASCVSLNHVTPSRVYHNSQGMRYLGSCRTLGVIQRMKPCFKVTSSTSVNSGTASGFCEECNMMHPCSLRVRAHPKKDLR